MQVRHYFRLPAVIDFHLPGGYTRVVTRFGPQEVPTNCIPAHHRGIGCRVTLIGVSYHREPGESVEDELRARRQGPSYIVERLDPQVD